MLYYMVGISYDVIDIEYACCITWLRATYDIMDVEKRNIMRLGKVTGLSRNGGNAYS